MIQGRRLGRPLLGNWHLCSFVVSVIGLSTLSADSSPREAPPACQLHSIRKPRLLLFTVQAPSSTLLCLLIYIPLKLPCDLSCPLVAPTKRSVPGSFLSLLLLYFEISGDVLIPHYFPLYFFSSFFEYWFQGRMLAASFHPLLCFPLYVSPCLVSSPLLFIPSKQTLVPPSSPKPLSPYPHNSSGWSLSWGVGGQFHLWSCTNTPPHLRNQNTGTAGAL